MGLRQVGLHHHLGLARIGHVNRGEILRRALVREPEDAAAVGGDLDRHAFAHAAEAVEQVVGDEPEIPGDRSAVAAPARHGGFPLRRRFFWRRLLCRRLFRDRLLYRLLGSLLRGFLSCDFHSVLHAYPLAFGQNSGRSAFFQSGMAEIFFSRRSTSASRCRPVARSGGELGSTSTRASAWAKVSRDIAYPFEV